MPRSRLVAAVGVPLAFLVAAGCTTSVRESGAAGPTLAPSPAATLGMAPTATPQPTLPATVESPPVVPPTLAPTESLTEPFDHGAFSDPATVDNRWFPLEPGTQWVFQGKANDGTERVSRKVVITVTDLVKTIDGVRSAVTYDLDYTAGQLGESELAFYAQDDNGTVWLMGEYPEEIEDGKIVEAPAWIAGREDAKAGILMKSEPEPYGPSWSEGWGPAVGWTDRARVFETDSTTCVPAGCYKDVLVIDEFNRDEPDAHQLKYYAPGVGGVRVGWAGAKEEEQEVLELARVVHLSPEAMAKIRAAALAQDKRSYKVSPDVFGGSAPLAPGS